MWVCSLSPVMCNNNNNNDNKQNHEYQAVKSKSTQNTNIHRDTKALLLICSHSTLINGPPALTKSKHKMTTIDCFGTAFFSKPLYAQSLILMLILVCNREKKSNYTVMHTHPHTLLFFYQNPAKAMQPFKNKQNRSILALPLPL